MLFKIDNKDTALVSKIHKIIPSQSYCLSFFLLFYLRSSEIRGELENLKVVYFPGDELF